MVDLSIVIVSYNGRDMLQRCLRGVEAGSSGIRVVITVVDNASSDSSAAMVRREFPWVQLECNETNLGFAAAANQGLRRVRARYHLLLNPDVIVAPTCLARMVEFMDERPCCGGATCRTYLDDFGGWQVPNTDRVTPGWCLLRTTRYLPGLRMASPLLRRHALEMWHLYVATSPQKVQAITGAFFMVRANVLESVGLLDEAYFMYFEDSDWSRRILQAGWSLWYNPVGELIHNVGGSSRGHEEELLRATFDSQHRFLECHYGTLAAGMVRGLRRMDQGLWRILAGGSVGHGRSPRQPEIVHDSSVHQDDDRLTWKQVSGASGYVCELAATPSFAARIGCYVRTPEARIPAAALRDQRIPVVCWRWVPVFQTESARPIAGHLTSGPGSVTFGQPQIGGSAFVPGESQSSRPAGGHP